MQVRVGVVETRTRSQSEVPGQRRQGLVVAVAVDEPEVSMDAVVWAADEAVRRGVPLELVHAMDVRHAPDPAQARAHAMQLLDAAVTRARTAVPGVDVRVRCEDVGAMALLSEESHRVTLLVMAKGAARDVPVEHLVGASGCPVVVV